MYKISKIKILPLAYTVSLIYFIFGLVLAVLLVALRSNTFITSFVNQNLLGLSLINIIILYPVAYGVGGFVMGIVIGYLYNQVSKLTGGISVQLVKDKRDKSDLKAKK